MFSDAEVDERWFRYLSLIGSPDGCWSRQWYWHDILTQWPFTLTNPALLIFLYGSHSPRYLLIYIICCRHSYSFFWDLPVPSTDDRDSRLWLSHLKWSIRMLFYINRTINFCSAYLKMCPISRRSSLNTIFLSDPVLYGFSATMY